jgi:outer membrane lipoprotein-sorting protein
MRIRILAALSLTALVAWPGFGAAPWGEVWESEAASSRLALAGRARTMTAEDGHSLEAEAAVTAAHGKLRFEYRLEDRHWSVIDDGKSLIHLLPRRQVALVYDRPGLAVDRALAERNYEARVVGDSSVAGRSARTIEISPKGGGRPVLRLWLDNETGFALRRERYNVEGRLTSRTEYTQVEFGPVIAPDVFTVPAGWETIRAEETESGLSTEQLSARLGFQVRPPAHLPAGYVLVGGYEKQWGRWHMRAAELRYTDGLRILSIFQHRHPGHPGLEPPGHGEHPGRGRGRGGLGGRGRGRRGGRHGRGGRGEGLGLGPPRPGEMILLDRGSEKVLRFHGPEIVVVVIGDLPRAELVRIAESIEH